MKTEAIDHPKMGMLCRALSIDDNQAVGIVTRLWGFTKAHAPSGHIGRWPATVIAEACHIALERDTWLLDGLVAARLVDVWPNGIGYIVHDWWDHCEDFVHMRLARRRLWFANGQAPKLTRFPHTPLRDELEHFYNNHAAPPITAQGELFVDAAPIPRKLNQPTRAATPDYQAQFEEFYAAYPIKRDKARAREAWIKRLRPSPELHALILKCVAEYITYTETMRQNKKFAPEYCGPAVWINKCRWEDVNELPEDLARTLDGAQEWNPTEEEIRLALEAERHES